MVRVIGKGRKERIVPYGMKAAEALTLYWPERERLLRENLRQTGGTHPEAIFLNYMGRRLTQRSVGRILKKYVRLININWDLHPHSLRHAFATHLLADGADLARDSRIAGAPIAFDNAEIYARFDSSIDGHLRQGPPARMRIAACLKRRILYTKRFWETSNSWTKKSLGDCQLPIQLMRFAILGAAVLAACCAWAYPSRAQDNYEIQVYGAELVESGHTMVELHSNFTFQGSNRPTTAPTRPIINSTRPSKSPTAFPTGLRPASIFLQQRRTGAALTGWAITSGRDSACPKNGIGR